MSLEALLTGAGITCEVRPGEPMSRHTSLRIGGPAELMVFPEGLEELGRVMALSHGKGIPLFVLGRGTNLLVMDGGIPGIVVNLRKLDWMELQRGASNTAQVHAGAGASLARLAGYCAERGLSGLEFTAGIPGTVGGAVAMNAGTQEAEMKDVLTSVTLVGRDGTISSMDAGALKMCYRRSELPHGSAVAEASFALISWPKEEVKERMAANLRRRKATQPDKVRSAGSTFKNPPGYSAWKLIDMAGLRGKTVGRAQVSRMHTNFLINLGGATARDFKALMELVISTVQEKLNITLEPEIKIVGVES